MQLAEIDLSDIYPLYEQELRAFQCAARAVARDIFWEHLRQPLAAAPLEALRARLPLFGSRLLDYLLELGDLVENTAGCLHAAPQVEARASSLEVVADYGAASPQRAGLAYFLTACREIAGGVLAGGDGLRLARARDPRNILKRWEEVMLEAPILLPCRQFAARALFEKLSSPRVVFEGGAGVGVVLRTLLQDARLSTQLANISAYYYTELDPGLLGLGKARLSQLAPKSLIRRMVYRQLDLDAFARDPAVSGLAAGSLDCVVLEHVLYDVADLHATLLALRQLLRPDGALIFTGAFRSRAATFFPCEMLQLTLASYRRAQLEPPYRTQAGYLSLAEWELSLTRAGFQPFVQPSPADQERLPHGGILALPAEAR